MSFKLHLILAWKPKKVFMQIRCNFPDISYLSETQKNNFQFLNILFGNKIYLKCSHLKTFLKSQSLIYLLWNINIKLLITFSLFQWIRKRKWAYAFSWKCQNFSVCYHGNGCTFWKTKQSLLLKLMHLYLNITFLSKSLTMRGQNILVVTENCS